jgi:uncharacterized protein YbaR (Trm112 family)
MIIPICKICKTHKIFVFELEKQIISCYKCNEWYDIKNNCYTILNYKEIKNEYHKDKEIFSSYYDAVIHRRSLRKLKKHSISL